MSRFLYLLFGVGIGVAGHYNYRKFNPQRKITLTRQQMISSYLQKNNMQKGYLINILKSIGFSLKSFYHYSLDTKIQGFNYNSTYLDKQEVRNEQKNIEKISCIFSPTQYICGHPEIQHGGATATIIDQNFGYLAMLNSRSGVATVDLNIKYKKPIRVDLFYVFEGNVIKRDGRKIWVKGQIKQLETGQVKVQSEGLFMTVNWDNQMTRGLTKFFQIVNFKDYNDLHHHQSLHKDYAQQAKQKLKETLSQQNLLNSQKIPNNQNTNIPVVTIPEKAQQKQNKKDFIKNVQKQKQKIRKSMDNKQYIDQQAEANISKMQQIVKQLEQFEKKLNHQKL